MILFLLISLGFVAIFLSMPMSEWSAKAWFGVLIFGAGSIVLGFLLLRPMTLDLDAGGFTFSGGITKDRRIAWRDVDHFFLWKLPRGGKQVAYKFVEGHRPATIIGKINGLVGVDGSLPNLFSIRGQELVDKLETYRARAAR